MRRKKPAATVQYKHVIGKTNEGIQKRIGHPHCPDCGSCLQFERQRHNCTAVSIDPEILEVFELDCNPKGQRASLCKAPEGYHEVQAGRD